MPCSREPYARSPDLAIFAATSGHSGVDRVVQKLVWSLAQRGLTIHVLKIRDHGPYLNQLPSGCHVIDFSSRHVETSLPSLMRYLRRARPRALLTDKDAVNRLAILARGLARVDIRLVVRLGTTVSSNIAHKRAWAAAIQVLSIRWLYRLADARVVPSRGAASDLARLMRVDDRDVTVLPNPVVDEALDRAAQQPIDEPWLGDGWDRPVIVAVGSLTARKDYATLLRAFARLRRDQPCRLILVGRGRCQSSLAAQARALGIDDDVRMTGFIANPYPYIQGADVFAHTARWEGLGIVLVEALALGTPVVATDCPSGPAEILKAGSLGRLVPVADDEALAAALRESLREPVDRRALRLGVDEYRTEASAAAYARVLGLTKATDVDR
jgi:glycosyltransferase involved in cell wall biosynthesis